jgi:hypothetical protein
MLGGGEAVNISQIMRSLIGDVRASDAKTLELKVGQVVKGMVLQILANQEAMVNIDGILVKAKLESPLNQGQMTMLQVQPESANGQIVLKPMGSSQVQIANESLADLLKGFGLKDQPANRQLLQQMHQEGIPLNKENVKQLSVISSAKGPEQIPSNQWIQSGVLAFQRGLPLTEPTLRAMHQVLFGQPVHQLTGQLQEQAEVWLQKNADTASVAVIRGVTQLQAGLQQLQTLGMQGLVPADTESAMPNKPTTQTTQMTQMTQMTQITQTTANVPGSVQPQKNAADLGKSITAPITVQASAAQSLTSNSSAQQPLPAGQPLSTDRPSVVSMPVNMNQTIQGSTTILPQAIVNTKNTSNQAESNQPAANTNHNTNEKGSSGAVQPANVAAAEPVTQIQSDTWISRLLKLMGIEHEQGLGKLPDKPLAGGTINPLLEQVPQEANRPTQPSPLDNLKNILMQLQSAGDIPPAMKENMQQLLQQITGQQLFMTADRSAHFSHITLFIPLQDENGEQTAAINIQSRKGKRGEIDASNCHLLFDLSMKSLGNTLVDVQVVNKIVSLRVHNDHPMISELLTSGREQIALAMQQTGYQLSSLTAIPYPDKEAAAAGANQTNSARGAVNSMYGAKTYKGVDIRV